MKSMTCQQLGGACSEVFTAESFEEIAELSKQHAMRMFQQNDAAHLEAASKMQSLMQSPEAMQAWFEERRNEFLALPDNTDNA